MTIAPIFRAGDINDLGVRSGELVTGLAVTVEDYVDAGAYV